MDGAEWYYQDDGVETGPFTWQRIADLLQAEIIGVHTLVRRSDSSEWLELAEAVRSALPSGERQDLNIRKPAPVHTISQVAPPALVQKEPETVDSEITLDAPYAWLTTPPAPWRRFGARFLDTGINGTLGFMLLGYVWYSVDPYSADDFFAYFESGSGLVVNYVASTFIAALIGALLIGLTGSSIGKLLFGIRVRNHRGNPIGVASALGRELHIWVSGLALGIPLIVWITCWLSYKKLTSDGATSWDEGKNSVTYRPNGSLQYILNAVGIILLFVVSSVMNALNRAQW